MPVQTAPARLPTRLTAPPTTRLVRAVLPVAVLAAALLLLAAPARAQHALADHGPYDPSIPTPASVLGYELGDAFTPHHMLVRYLTAVADASPRVRLDTVGTTYEGREVLLVVVTSEANQARLDGIRDDIRLLADPRGAATSDLDRAVAATPTVAWLGYSIHGNEASGVEAGLATLYQLAAGQDEGTRMVLDSVVVLIDPVQNPDGHERHVQDVMRDRGAFGPDPHPEAMINSSGWPGARTSHYLFDLNRDWFLHTHPTTRARTGAYLDWAPHVAVDAHEMGSNSTYFFAPPMPPLNPNVEARIPGWWDTFAEGNAAAMAAEGWGFYTGESFDEFYPGYGVSWPVLTGAIGMTYEQASSDGGAIRRADGTVLTLREAAAHHYTTSMATLRTVAERRTARVSDYLAFRRSAITEREGSDFRTVILEPDAQGRAAALVATLRSNRIEVGRLTRAADIRATEYGTGEATRVRVPAGAWVVDLAQPQGRLAKAILEPNADLPPDFIEEELQARREGRGDRFYDVTAWSLPFTFRVRAWQTAEAPGSMGPVEAIDRVPTPSVALPDRAGFAYAWAPGSEASYRLLGRLLAADVRVRHAPRPFRIGDADFPGGAFLALVHRNRDRTDPDLHGLVREAAQATGTTVRALHTALVDEGTDLGSNSVQPITGRRVALAGGSGTSAYSFGAAWFAFDRLLQYPVTRVELEDLDDALDDFDTVVLPSAFGLQSALGEGGLQELERWVRDGGTLVALDGATAALVDMGFLSLRQRTLAPDSDGSPPLPASVPGAILRTVADTLSPLTAGLEGSDVPVLVSGSRIYEAPADARPGQVALRFAEGDALRLSGYLWPEVPERLGGTTYLWTESKGAGHVIAFTGDPNFRGSYRGLVPLFANAIFLGSTF